MSCIKCNIVHKTAKDGAKSVILRCADPGCPLFTVVVTDDQCTKCSRNTTKVELKIPVMPGKIHQLKSWTGAIAEWVHAGRPERSDEETVRLFETTCKVCDWLDPKSQKCRSCGCNASGTGPALLNKIRMGTQHCPRNYW